MWSWYSEYNSDYVLSIFYIVMDTQTFISAAANIL